jgi:hypothetical protein
VSRNNWTPDIFGVPLWAVAVLAFDLHVLIRPSRVASIAVALVRLFRPRWFQFFASQIFAVLFCFVGFGGGVTVDEAARSAASLCCCFCQPIPE